jgi:hypothetical protein
VKNTSSTGRIYETCLTPSPTARLFVSTEESHQLVRFGFRGLLVASLVLLLVPKLDMEGRGPGFTSTAP